MVFRGVLLGLPTLGLGVMLCLVVLDVARSAREAFREGYSMPEQPPLLEYRSRRSAAPRPVAGAVVAAAACVLAVTTAAFLLMAAAVIYGLAAGTSNGAEDYLAALCLLTTMLGGAAIFAYPAWRFAVHAGKLVRGDPT